MTSESVHRKVVVTGVGAVTSLGVGMAATWAALLEGRCGIARIQSFDPSEFPCQIAGETPAYRVADFVPKSYRKATKVMARDIEHALVAADDAFKSSGLQSKAYTEQVAFDAYRFGCNIGAGLISAELNELTYAFNTARAASSNQLDLKKWGSEGMQQLTPLWLLKYLPNMLACHVTIVHGLKGPSNTVTCADASGHLAIGEAFRTIQRGDADIAICGGAHARINPMSFMRQTLIGRLNTASNDKPETSVRPFDTAASGAIIGEGGGLLILEDYEHAKARGAKILCEVAGFGASQDAYSLREPDPAGTAHAAAIKKALADARVSVPEIGCLIPCGTGHPKHDAAELAGLHLALGENLAKTPLALPKSQIGHLESGSAAECAMAVMSIATDTVPPAINVPAAKLNASRQARKQSVNVAVSTVWSIGGQNAVLVFKKI